MVAASSVSSFPKLAIHKSLNFGELSLELHNFSMSRWESDTSGTLSLYSAGTCLKLERPTLMHILWCRIVICN